MTALLLQLTHLSTKTQQKNQIRFSKEWKPCIKTVCQIIAILSFQCYKVEKPFGAHIQMK